MYCGIQQAAIVNHERYEQGTMYSRIDSSFPRADRLYERCKLADSAPWPAYMCDTVYTHCPHIRWGMWRDVCLVSNQFIENRGFL